MLLRPPDVGTLSSYVGFVNANVAREVGRLHDWPERFWGRRFRSIPVLDEAAAVGRLKYILAQGVKEGLVASPLEWPGPHCAAALTAGTSLVGTWFDRTAAYLARRRGRKVDEREYITEYPVPLSPLPAWQNLHPDERCLRVHHLVRNIEAEARQQTEATGQRMLGPAGIQARDPHTRPAPIRRSPAPFVHASCPCMRLQFRRRYRRFVAALRAAASRVTSTLASTGCSETTSRQTEPVPACLGIPP